MPFQIDDQNESDDGSLADINIVPMVDVLLVLLVIFMVTAPLSIGGIKVELPYSKARSSAMDENRIVLSVNAEGQYFIDKVQIMASTLEAKLKAIYEFREKKEIYIRADRQVLYAKVVDAMSAARVAGVRKMSMLTQSPKAKK
tara:strand:- start:165 stop:593 length:429 start_codon:yes stop_codon:yes gene_type:complete